MTRIKLNGLNLLAQITSATKAAVDAATARQQAEVARAAAVAAQEAAQQAQLAAQALVLSDLGTTDGQTRALLDDPASQTAKKVAAGFSERRDGLAWPNPAPHTGGLFLFEGDSLTDGAAGSSWRPDFARSARGALGDGGPGFHLFSNGQRVDRGAGAGWSSYAEFSIGDGSTWGGLFYGGLRSTADGASFSWDPASRWDEARLFYLKQPGGGTFLLSGPSTRPDARPTINTGTVNADGTGGAVTDYAIGSVVVPNATGAYNRLDVVSNVGPVVLLGADFKNTARPNGFRYGNLAIGGKTLAQFAAMRDDLRRQFYTQIAPAALAINLGMNDRGTANAATHQSQLTALMTATQEASPTTGVWVVQSNEPGDAGSNNFLSYVAAKKAAAAARKAAYYDERTVLGDYTTANARGYMADGVHPNAAGNHRRANGLLTAMGIPAGAADPGADAYTVPNSGSGAARGTLTTKTITATAGAAQVIYNLGAASNFSDVLIELEVHGQRTGTSGHSLQRFHFLVHNTQAGASHPGKATAGATVTAATLYQNNPGDGGLQSATITHAIDVDKLAVSLTAAYNGQFVITGRWLSITAGTGGRRIWEL